MLLVRCVRVYLYVCACERVWGETRDGMFGDIVLGFQWEVNLHALNTRTVLTHNTNS